MVAKRSVILANVQSNWSGDKARLVIVQWAKWRMGKRLYMYIVANKIPNFVVVLHIY